MPERQRLLELALKGLEADRAKLDEEIAEIKSQLGGRSTAVRSGEAVATTGTPRKKDERMSAEARRKIPKP